MAQAILSKRALVLLQRGCGYGVQLRAGVLL